MKKYNIINILLIASLTATLNSCAVNASKKTAKNKKSSVPKVPAKQLPGGTTDNWRYLGTSQDGQIAVEINESSVSKSADQTKFQDRKTIINSAALNKQTTLGNYKYSLSWWNMSCTNKQYFITSTIIYDDYGKLIKSYDFSNTQPIAISDGSIAELQYKYVCQGINRQIGY